MNKARSLSFGVSFVLHAGAIAGLVFVVSPSSGAKVAAPPTIELMLPPMAAAEASSVQPVEATEVQPVEATEVTPPEPQVIEAPTPELPVMAEAVEAVDPVVAVAAEKKPEPPKEKPKPRERAERRERPKKPVPAAAETVANPAPPQAVASVAVAGVSDTAGGGNPGARADFKAQISAWVEKHKRYPDRLRRRGLQGAPVVRFRIDRAGRVLDCRLDRGSPHEGIDEAALETIRRAEPFPSMPDDLPGQTMEFTVPINFSLR